MGARRAALRSQFVGLLKHHGRWPAPGSECLRAGLAAHAGARRGLHKGHVGRTLEKSGLPRQDWLTEVDQAPEKSNIRQHKDKYLREIGSVYRDMQGLFSSDPAAQKAVLPTSQEDLRQQEGSRVQKENVNEAMRMYRLLRPDAPPFYEEDAMLGMKAKMNRLHSDERPTDALMPEKSKYGDPFQAYLPVVNQRAFLVALESVVESLADDIETMCLLVGLDESTLPAENDPLRFKKLLDTLFSAFPLRKDPSHVDDFMKESWPRLRNLLPDVLASLEEERVAEWLRGHLRRVRLNQQRQEAKINLHQSKRFGDEIWYSFAEDFPYDDDPMPAALADERNLDFPLDRAAEYMSALLTVLSDSPVAAEFADVAKESNNAGEVAKQFQDFVWDLDKVGLRSWLRMDVSDLEQGLPKGHLEEPQLEDGDLDAAKMMLRCAARGKANLLDFDEVDPYKLLHDLPAQTIDQELSQLPPHPVLSDSALESLVDSRMARHTQLGGADHIPTDREWLRHGATVDEVFRRELDFYRTAGPVEWTEDKGQYTWRWRQPLNTFWDDRRKVFVPEREGVDPSLNFREMRQHLLEIRRMCNMMKDGRIYYYRALIIVGNGKGVYGFGVGFANTPKEARADGALKALQNLDYIDMDSGRMLCTPVIGREYRQACSIIPRPIGRGLLMRKKFYPLAYILGLDNCKLKFPNWKYKWFSRMRAIKRALDGIVSRRTLANMTGKRYALLIAPGDHWVHWPDRWFSVIRESYDAKAEKVKLARRHALHFRKRANVTAVPAEFLPGWRKQNWARWNNPLERWLQVQRQFPPHLHPKPDSEGSSRGGAGNTDDKLLETMKAQSTALPPPLATSRTEIPPRDGTS